MLPEDLPRLDLGTGLAAGALADVLVPGGQRDRRAGLDARDLSFDNAILERVIDVLGGQATVASVAAALRALAQVGDPRDDVAAGLISAEQMDRLTAMFGRERRRPRRSSSGPGSWSPSCASWPPSGTALVPLPRSALRVVAVGQRAGAVEEQGARRPTWPSR